MLDLHCSLSLTECNLSDTNYYLMQYLYVSAGDLKVSNITTKRKISTSVLNVARYLNDLIPNLDLG